MVIWKSTLEVTDIQPVVMPKGAKILHVGVQNDAVCVWFLCDPKAPKEMRTIQIIGTGNPISGEIGEHIGTVQIPPFVWHIFELPYNPEDNPVKFKAPE